MSDIQELVYNYLVEQANKNTQGIIFHGGYTYIVYNNMPYILNNLGVNKIDIVRKEAVPFSEMLSLETPSTNATNRGEFNASYNILYRIENGNTAKVKQALVEFRNYMFANKQTTLDENGTTYKVAFKVSRANKLSNLMIDGGNVYGQYSIKVSYTIIENGYILKDTDTVAIKRAGEQDYTVLNDIGSEEATDYNSLVSITSDIVKSYNQAGKYTSTIRLIYDGSALHENIRLQCKNKGDKEEIYSFRETFNGIPTDYNVQIKQGNISKQRNGVVIMTFIVGEV